MSEPPVDAHGVCRMLRHRVYTGEIALTSVRPQKYYGTGLLPAEWVPAHEPIISKEEFALAQRGLRDRRAGGDRPRDHSRTADWLMRGLARCGACGARVTALPRSKGTRGHHQGYYVCRRRLLRSHQIDVNIVCEVGQFVRKEDADAFLEKVTLDRLMELRGALLLPPPAPPKKPNFDKKRADIAARRKRLVAAVAAGKLELEDIDTHVRELDAALEEVEAEAAAHEAELAGDSLESRRAALAFVENVAEAWAGLTPPERRTVIATLAEGIVVPVKGAPEVTWRDASRLAGTVRAAPAEESGVFEP